MKVSMSQVFLHRKLFTKRGRENCESSQSTGYTDFIIEVVGKQNSHFIHLYLAREQNFSHGTSGADLVGLIQPNSVSFTINRYSEPIMLHVLKSVK